MRDRILRLYFPALIPRRRHAKKWRCLAGYDAVQSAEDSGAVKVVQLRFKAKDPKAVGKRLLFFSDLHYSPGVAALGDELCSILKKHKVDLLLCGGDLCSDAQSLSALPPLLDKLAASAPLCATVPGNWERGKSWLPQSFWQELFSAHKWHYLCNSALNVDDWGWLYGCDDLSKGFPEVPSARPADREKLFLVHRPDTVISVDRESPLDDFSLLLCGHTHGGQIRLPLLGALTAPSFYGRRFACGLYSKENSDSRMIVSTGVHHASFPWRINCRREVLLIEFE